MLYRRLDPQGDMQFGQGRGDFLKDTPDTVAQAVVTRLRLLVGEWFLDLQEGTPWRPAVLGKHTQDTYDAAIRTRILDTQGVVKIAAYESRFNPDTRTLSVSVRIDTVYGPTRIEEVL